MGGTGVIDRFLGIFTQYIDSGFGLIQGDVRWLAGVLIAIDITLAGLFWAFSSSEEVIGRLVKKTLYIGAFAFIIGNYSNLAEIIFSSFSGLGLQAGGNIISASQLLQPGKLAQVGVDAGKPILDSISGLMGFVSFFDNFIQIVILLIAWLIVVVSFFIMAVQLFVGLIEFKLTTLAGFVLVPFGLFGRTAFLAEKVLGNVFSSGVKVLVLAVIVGIGSTIFGQFTSGFNNPPTIDDALTLILASLALLGLSIFGTGIASGLVAGDSPALFGRYPYDWQKDFAFVTAASFQPLVLLVNPKAPEKDFAAFLEAARREPGRLTIGTAGAGSFTHLAGLLLEQLAGVRFEAVHYRGTAPGLNDLMAGQISFQFEPIATALPLINDGRLKALAVTSLERAPTLPNVPTIAESGVPGYEAINLLGLIAPAGTPAAVIERLSGAMKQVLGNPAVIKRFADLGTEARFTSPQAFFEIMRTQADTWIPVIRKANIKLE